MTPLLYRLGQFCSKRRVLVVGVWLAAAIGLGAWTSALGGTQLTDNVTLPGTGSQHALDVIQRGFGTAGVNGSNPIVFRAPAGESLTDAGPRAALSGAVAALARDPLVVDAVSPLTPAGAAQLSRSGRIAYISLTLRASATQLTHAAALRLLATVRAAARPARLDVAAGGYLGQELSSPSSSSSEAIGLLAAVVVLVLTFGTLVAAGLPIITALFGLGIGLSAIALLSQVAQVPSTTPALATMIGLGVGIDDSLFVVTRRRSQLVGGPRGQRATADRREAPAPRCASRTTRTSPSSRGSPARRG